MSFIKRLFNKEKDYFEEAVEYILSEEGGYVNDPRDPGGETKYGISKRSFPEVDIKHLTRDEAKNIYREQYYNAASCHKMSTTLALCVFDSAVNQGVGNAIKMLQEALGVLADGVIGPVTLSYLEKVDQEKLAVAFTYNRIIRYRGTINFDRYGKGWIQRAIRILREAPPYEKESL